MPDPRRRPRSSSTSHRPPQVDSSSTRSSSGRTMRFRRTTSVSHTSAGIAVSPGSTFLIFYHRYDLTGRTVGVLPIGSNNTDDANLEVSYGGGPWTKLGHYSGQDMSWRGVSFNLTANITQATTIQVRFNASSNVMGKRGGWWIDDVMIAALGLGRAVLLLGSVGPYEASAGGTAHIALKLANVGDYETDFRLDTILPSGWDANLEGGSGRSEEHT